MCKAFSVCRVVFGGKENIVSLKKVTLDGFCTCIKIKGNLGLI